MIAPVVKGVAVAVVGFVVGAIAMKEAATHEAEATVAEREGRAAIVNSYNQELLDQCREKQEQLNQAETEIATLRQQLQEKTQQLLEYQTRLDRLARDTAAAAAGSRARAPTPPAPAPAATAQSEGKGRVRGRFF